MAKSVVSIVKGTDADKMIEEAFNLLGGVSALIKPNSTVVIKPNAGHPVLPETAGCTSPEMVASTIRVVKKANPKDIIVAESAAMGCDTIESYDVSGITKAAQENGARLIDIKREKDLISVPIRDAQSAVNRVLLPRFLIEADHIINLPIFKPHIAMVFTCALKNLKGTVQDKVHHTMHQTDLGLAMVDLCSVVKADLHLVDMIHPQEGFGPQNGIRTDFGCVVLGKDPVSVDATCCRMVGLDPLIVNSFIPAHERGLGNYDEKDIEIKGKKIKDVYKELWIPFLRGFKRWPEYKVLMGEGACSSCQGLVAYNLERLKCDNEYDKNAGATIMIGRHKEIPKGVDTNNLFLCGDCTKKFSGQGKGYFVKGCPPNETTLFTTIVTRQERKENLNERPDSGFTKEMVTRNAASIAKLISPFIEYSKKIRDTEMAEKKAAKKK